MGFVLDSSVLIAGERKGWQARQVIVHTAEHLHDEDLALSVITIMELAHGIARAGSSVRKAARSRFLEDLAIVPPIYPISSAVALLAGKLDGESAAQGTRVGVADLLIGVTALHLGYGVATSNLRHFRMIPGLQVAAV